MKLIVQIPCLNEEATLAKTVADIPRRIPGVDEVEILLVDDGSTDGTLEVARAVGVDYIVSHRRNRGLGCAFRTGLDAAVRLGADIIVNTDGDNQYAGADIPALIRPILDGKADMVVGDRRTSKLAHFSPLKRWLQWLGSFAVRIFSGADVADAVSGFRAFSREAALQITVVSPFSYTIETTIEAGRKRLAIASVPVRTNGKTRPSRLFRNIPQFVAQSLAIMLRIYAMYRPLLFFCYLSALLSLVGLVPIARFLYYYCTGNGGGHIQSLVLGGMTLGMGFVALMIGVVADLVSQNRQMIEMVLEKVRRLEGSREPDPDAAPARGIRGFVRFSETELQQQGGELPVPSNCRRENQ